ncbi:Mitochondrial transcription termination factor family protein [Euphorbia peplus]|nr:Mitochondrial transcription termination factor family protein [Euphorbia peplus]WCJ17912.1 Mitochondrial transcription termination factor family protein [Euphorbia peplus]
MHPLMCRIASLKCSHKFPIFTAHNITLVSFSTCTPDISIFDYLVNHHHFSPECAAKVSSSTNSLYKPHNVDSFLNFLNHNGFSHLQIESILRKQPRSLFSNFHTTTKPKIKVFQDLGFHSSDFAHIISSCPSLLTSSSNRLRLSILALKNVLGPNADISTLLKNPSTGRFLRYDLEKIFVPNIDYLKSCGICPLQIASYVCRCPLFFLHKPEKLKVFVERVDAMGVDRQSKKFIEAFRVLSSYSRENWELKLQLFRELGFSEHDILVAFRRAPHVFGQSESKIKEVIQLLLSVEDISYIASNPTLITYSVEKRLKPRLRVLNALQTKNLLDKRPGLAHFLAMSNARFIDKYVSPYSDEVGGLYAASQCL